MILFLVLLHQEAFGGDIGPKGEVWSTYSKIGQHVMGIVFTADLKSSFDLKPSHLGFPKEVSKEYTSVIILGMVHEFARSALKLVLLDSHKTYRI